MFITSLSSSVDMLICCCALDRIASRHIGDTEDLTNFSFLFGSILSLSEKGSFIFLNGEIFLTQSSALEGLWNCSLPRVSSCSVGKDFGDDGVELDVARCLLWQSGLSEAKVSTSTLISLPSSTKQGVFRYDIRRSASDLVIRPHWSANAGTTAAALSVSIWLEVHGAQWICNSSQALQI